MKTAALMSLALALACSSDPAPKIATTAKVKAPHQFIVQPVVESPPPVINADGQTIIRADPSELFRGVIPADHPVKVDDGFTGAGAAGDR